MTAFVYAPAPILPLMAVDPAPPPNERESVGLALRAARKAAKLSTAQAAHLAGISVAQLSAIERGDHPLTSVSAGGLSHLPAAFGMSWRTFVAVVRPVYGTYMTFLPDAQDGAVAVIEHEKADVPVYDLAAANPDGNMSYARALMTIKVDERHIKAHTRAYAVLGDSMDDGSQRSIRDGDVVLVNQADLALKEGKVYVVMVPGNGILLKRYTTYADGTTALASDNTSYRPLAPDEAQIIGRVYMVIPQHFEP